MCGSVAEQRLALVAVERHSGGQRVGEESEVRHRHIERDVGFEVGSAVDGHVDRLRLARLERDVGLAELDATDVMRRNDGEDVLIDGPMISSAAGVVDFLVRDRGGSQLGHLAVGLGVKSGTANDDRGNDSTGFRRRFENDAAVVPLVGQDAAAFGGDAAGQSIDMQLDRTGEAVLPRDLHPQHTVHARRQICLVGVGEQIEVRPSVRDLDGVKKILAAAQVHVADFDGVFSIGRNRPGFDPRIL